MHHRPSSVALFSHSQRLFLTSDEAPARQHTMSCIAALRRADNHLAADSAPTRRGFKIYWVIIPLPNRWIEMA